MVDAGHFIVAVPAALFGIVALWASASRRHWFLRTAVLFAVVVAPMLIPAYEVVIGAAVEVILVAGAAKLTGYRRWRRERQMVQAATHFFTPRWSLQTLLLITAIVAAVAAVAAKMPAFAEYSWAEMVGNGLIAGVAVVSAAGLLWAVPARRFGSSSSFFFGHCLCPLLLHWSQVFWDGGHGQSIQPIFPCNGNGSWTITRRALRTGGLCCASACGLLPHGANCC